MTPTAPFDRLLAFIRELDARKLRYSLGSIRDESLLVTVATPGVLWEVEFMNDGGVEVEKYVSDGNILGQEAVEALLAED